MVYMFLAAGFEEVEALAPLDLLRRAGVEIKTVGVSSKTVVGSHGIPVVADLSEGELSEENIEMIILPGGMPGTLNLDANETVHKYIDLCVASGAYIAAICAAPSILGSLGLLKGKKAICYPGFEDKLIGAEISDGRVAIDGKFITAKGMGAAIEFGLALVGLLCGEDKAASLKASTISE